MTVLLDSPPRSAAMRWWCFESIVGHSVGEGWVLVFRVVHWVDHTV